MRGRLNRKILVFGAVVLLLLTGLSPAYAGFSYSKSESIDSNTIETTKGDIEPTNIDNENLVVRGSFLDKYKSSENEERYRNKPYPHRHDKYNQIRKPTVIDGVDGSWDIVVPDDYDTIQEAIYAAKDGFIIFVKSGIYYENIKIRSDSSLTLHGEDKESTIIDASYYSDVIRIEGSATGVNISGFTIKNSGDGFAGLNISSHYNIIRDNILVDNDYGIKIHSSSGNQIWNNEITENNEDGILLHRSYANNISGNTIINNGVNGIEFTYSSLGSILDNNEISNHDENGVYIDESSLGNMFTRCTIKENNYGVLCAGVSDGNIFHHNAFVENGVNAFDSSLDRWDYNGIGNFWDDYTGEDKDGDGIGDTPYSISGGNNEDRFPLMSPAMMYGDFEHEIEKKERDDSGCSMVSMGSSQNNDGWDIIVPDDYPTIQEAINHSEAEYRILVREGVYKENVLIDRPSLTLHGEDKENTVINGMGVGHVVFVDSSADGFDISGFTIQSSGKHFTGLYLYSDSSYVEDIIFQDCNIGVALRGNSDNVVKGNSFAGNNYGSWTWMCTNSIIECNNIVDNVLDGMVLQWSSNINISGNNIENNFFDGVLEISCSEIKVDDNCICGNGEFGLQMFSSNGNIFKSNIVNDNYGDGVSFHKSNKNVLINNIITNNSNYGVSFRFLSSDNSINGNNIISNDYSGIRLDYSSDNSISENNIIGNNYYGIRLDYSSDNSISENNIIGNNGGGINIYSSSDNNSIRGNNITGNNYYGIRLSSLSDNSISGNNITGNIKDGIILNAYSYNNTINNNSIFSNNGIGINITYSRACLSNT